MPPTEGQMTVYNDALTPVSVSVTNNVNMHKTFPGSTTINSGQNTSAELSTSGGAGLSSFDVNSTSVNKIHVQLAEESYDINLGFHLLIFNGPGLLQSLADSFIHANLPALLQYVKANPIKIDVIDDWHLTITSITLDSDALQCAYASLLPPSATGSWNFSVMLRVNQGVVGVHVPIEGKHVDVSFSCTDAVIWVKVSFDPTFQTKPQVKELQMSLGDYNLFGNQHKHVEILPAWLKMFDHFGARTAWRVAGLINTILNKKILDKLNSIIGGIDIKPITGIPLPTSVPLLPGGKDLSRWMSIPAIQNLTLSQLKLPGTHDSATYALSGTLSSVKYDDISFLWDINEGEAPANGKFPIPFHPSGSDQVFVGKALRDWVMRAAVNSISRTQDLTILQQLQAGIRHFDFRVYYDKNASDFYTQHALRGPSFREILAQIQGFLDINPGATELIFANISHTNLSDDMENYPTDLANLVKSIIPANSTYYFPVSDIKNPFDFQSLAGQPICNITSGTSKVMFICSEATFPHTITCTNGYGEIPYAGEQYTPTQIAQQQNDMTQRPAKDKLWAINWVLGADVPGIVQNILTNLTRGQDEAIQFALQIIAANANSYLPAFLQQLTAEYNVVTIDWLNYGLASGVPELVIGMNPTLPN